MTSGRRRDRSELTRALRRTPVPDAAGAEERAWRVIQAAYDELEPAPRTLGRGRRQLALAFVGGLAIAAIALTPAGAKVGELVTETLGIDSDQALPELRRLPAPGELLVESADGAWIVRADGSKRLLGGYHEASWSPRGRFVSAADGDDLVALEPGGDVRWTVTAPAAVHDPRWGGDAIDTRIAYRSGGDLWVVAGDGTEAHLIARDVAAAAPIWLPPPADAKPGLDPSVSVHRLAYVDRAGSAHIVDADSGRELEPASTDRLRLRAVRAGRASSPAGDSLAWVTERRERSALVVEGPGGRKALFSAPGRFTDPVWSPDGRWLLIGWREADQWLFIRSDPRSGRPGRPPRVVPIDTVSREFDPGGAGAGGFPLPSGWVLPER
jgi:hypothetical protein